MKKFATPIAIAAISIALTSCLKDKGTNTIIRHSIPSTAIEISGKWSVVSDSSSTEFWGIWSGQQTQYKVYAGKPADYYNFTSYGVMYSNMNNARDTEYYKLNGDTILFRKAYYDVNQQLDSTYNPGFIVKNFTGSSCTLYSTFISPETIGTANITLRK